MAVDVNATLPRPVRLGPLIGEGRRILAEAFALAAARLSGGELHDWEHDRLRGITDPDEAIRLTRLPPGAGDFGERCERYVRQFANLNGWPRDRSMA
ncbi:hypothetical protein [Symbioplanes lichenis]|uniref:hypothetical protein n=1 Tax=Symbioplanes lichenis TaxID=1629072 RepID=UPI002739CCF4|nr:hypothetical protein [Actinoplanes lichenis]